MLENYYKILGVLPNAGEGEIARAFRRRATEFHPDHGGSAEEMKRVTEAWQILSNPETRRRYDKARARQHDMVAQAAAAADAAKAAAVASDYPKVWSDFLSAKYGKTEPLCGVPFPTVTDSISGAVFMIVGGAFGLFFFGYLTYTVAPSIWKHGDYFFIGLLDVIFGAAPGAWLAIWLHASIRSDLLKPNRPAVSSSESSTQNRAEIIKCPRCGKKLRVPCINRVLTITCPICCSIFEHECKNVEKPSSAGFIIVGYLCGIIALFVLPPAFALAGFICGLVNLSKGRMGHGVAQIVLSVSCGILGALAGFLIESQVSP